VDAVGTPGTPNAVVPPYEADDEPPPPSRPGSSIQRIATLGAIVFLAAILAWPILVWGLSVAGLSVPNLCT
jgi:hypothetical protein